MKDVVVAIALWLLGSAAFAQTFTSTAGGPIPDGAGVGPNNYGAPLDVPILVSGVAQGTIDTVSVAFNANHTWVGDLEVTLISPYGQEHLLFARTGATDANGGSPANLVAANAHTFSDTAVNNWWTVAGAADVTIPASTARTVVSGGPGVSNPPPVTSILSVFQRRPPNGTWTLRFRDGWGGDNGNVVSASITLTTTGVTRTVTKIDDSNDGVCDADCSLREAIRASSDGAASVDRIEFARPLFATPRRIVVGSDLTFFTITAFALVGPGAPLLNLSGAGLRSIRFPDSRKRHVSGLRVTDFTQIQIGGPTRLHGMEFAFLTGGIILDDAEMTDSSVHSIHSSDGFILRLGSLSTLSTLRRVTVSGNAIKFSGSFAATILAQSALTLIDCSIVGNQVNGSSAVGGVVSADGVVRVQNSVIAGNRATGSTPLGNDVASVPGRPGSFQSLGHNLIGDVGSVAVFNQAGDQTGNGAAPLDPVLSPLSRHGGTIPVHVPLPGSPLLDRGKRVGADARGVPLVDLSDVTPATGGNNGDIGAVELSPGLVSNLNDSGAGSLRQALLDAPAAPAITDILFSLNLPPAARITLTSGQLSIDRNVSIHGPGAQKLSISGNRQSRVLAVLPNRRVSISGLTLIDGNGVGAPSDQTGGIVLGAEGSQISIVDSVLRNGVAALGVGGLYVLPNAYLELIGSTATDMFTNAVVSLDVGSALLIHRSTISGCALNCLADNADSEASLIDSTISGAENTVVNWVGRLLLRNSLLAGRADFAAGASTVISAGHNLVGATESTAFNGADDQVGTLAAPIDARLSPLAQHGGPVPTHVPLAGSPALDKGLRFGRDARGLQSFDISSIAAATAGNNSDIGATEAQAVFVSNTNDSGAGSLRQAILDANANGTGLDDVLFDLSAPSTIVLASRLPNPIAGGALNLLGTGANQLTISGDSVIQLFSFTAPGHLGMSRLNLINFRGVDGPALEVYQSEVHLTELEVSGNVASGTGGAMLIGDADAVIQSSTFAGNSATGNYGALAYLGSNSRMQIRNSTFSGNAGPAGSAIANVARGAGASVLEIDSATLAANTGSAALTSVASSSGAASSSAQNTLFSGAVSSINTTGALAGFSSRGFNLSTTAEPLLNQGTDRTNANAALAPLANNGGSTRTHAPGMSSAAMDAGIRTSIVDQRGSPRPRNEVAVNNVADSNDIGAVEVQPTTLAGTPSGDVFEITGNSSTTTVRLNGTEIFNQPTANHLSLTLDGKDGADTFNVLSIAIPLQLIGDAGADVFNIGSANSPGNPGLLTPISAAVVVSGGPGADQMTVDGSAEAAAADYTIASTSITRSTPAGFGGVSHSSLASVALNAGSGINSVFVASTGTASTSISTGAGDDSIVFADGVSLNNGTVDAGADNDTLSYAAFSAGVAVNLGLNATTLTANLDTTQRIPALFATPSASATLTFNAANKTFGLTASVLGLQAADVTGIRLLRAPVGSAGPLVVNLSSLGTRTPTPNGFDYSVSNVALPPLEEAALLGGLLYLDFSTAPAAGFIRGNFLGNANASLASGTATGTGGISNIERVLGGSGADSLVGSFASNTLSGGAGDDTLVGGPGGDSLAGDSGADAIAWNNGDGSDVIEGGSEVDVLQVNGSTAAEQFTVNANGARLAVARTSPGPFTLDVGSTEALVMAGSGGDDGFTLGSLVGVAQVNSLQFSGLGGNDQFTLTPIPNGTPRAVRVNGGLPFATGDSLSLALGGVSNPVLTLDANASGSFTSSSHQSIDITSIESVPALVDPIFRNGFE